MALRIGFRLLCGRFTAELAAWCFCHLFRRRGQHRDFAVVWPARRHCALLCRACYTHHDFEEATCGLNRCSPYEGCQACGRVRYFFVVRFSYAGGSLRRQILAALLLSGRGLVKVERSRARGRVASNTLIRPRPDIHFSPRLPPPGRAVKSFFLSRFFLRARFAPQGGSFLCRARCLSRSPAPIRASHRASPSCRA